MNEGGIGSLITTLPRVLGSFTSSFCSSKILTSYPGAGLVTLPGKVGKTFLYTSRLRKLEQIGHPVSVYHQLSLMITCGKCL
jgi:hypothetical protein